MSEINVDINELSVLTDLKDLPHTISKVESKELKKVNEWFSETSLFSMLNEYLKQIEGNENYFQINSFLEGSLTPYSPNLSKLKAHDLFKFLSEMPTSIRLTNVHKFIAPAKEACLQIFNQTGIPAVCNMYITPSDDKNCFNFHGDYQDNIIQQLKGAKRWLFPTSGAEGDLLLQDKAPFSQFYDNKLALNLNEGNSISFGNSVVHKAQSLPGDISIHLTYAIFARTQVDLREFFALRSFTKPRAELLKMKSSHKKELLDLVESAKAEVAKMNSSDLVDEYLAFIEKENLRILKKGRWY